MTERAVHPRPQLTREHWSDLCGTWWFAYDDDDRGLDHSWWERTAPYTRTITVPFPPESPASGIGDRGPHPIVWYRRTFRARPAEPGGRMLLHFGAVDYRAQVWVNHRWVGGHEGGHTPFEIDVTAALEPGDADQVLVVRAEDPTDEPSQPRGKQHSGAAPSNIWYHRTTGIWQPVWLEPVPATRIDALSWTPNVARGSLGLRIDVAGPRREGLAARVLLRLGEEILAEDTYRVDARGAVREITLNAAHDGRRAERLLWSPEHPTLLHAEVSLLDDGAVVDHVRSYTGFREVGAADRCFRLNGRPYFLRMVLEQGYWPQSHLAAPDGAALRREVELIKSLGFNGVRLHQKLEDPRFLYWCDRLGLLVWTEMPSAFAFTTRTMERVTREWTEAVVRDRGHPCVAAWVPLNESWGVPALATDPAQRDYAAALYHLTRALDPTRPVISNDGWEHVGGDIRGVHDYAPDGAALRERYGSVAAAADTIRHGRSGGRRIALDEPGAGPERPVMITEYGGLSYAPAPDREWFGYSTVHTREEFLRCYRELTEALLDSPALAGFCYTQLTDTEQETNGLLTAEREPKLDPEAVRAIHARPAAAVPTEQVAAFRAPRKPAAPPDDPR